MSEDAAPYTTEVESPEDDVAIAPSQHADSPSDVAKFVSEELRARYDVYSYRQAAAILTTAFPDLWKEIEAALISFSVDVKDIALPGGNESKIPKKFTAIMRPNGWRETRIQGDLVVRVKEAGGAGLITRDSTIPNYIDGHKIDYVKDKVAVDFEWNSKDQTFDRDLYAFRTFHECGVIGAGVMVTRSALLNPYFSKIAECEKDGTPKRAEDGNWIPVKRKYGASTTWMGKLLYRLNAGRHGSCPVLVFGIRPEAVSDLEILDDPRYPFGL